MTPPPSPLARHCGLVEQVLEATGRVVHPVLSSVLYVSGVGDPTLVLDEALDGPPARRVRRSAARARNARPGAEAGG